MPTFKKLILGLNFLAMKEKAKIQQVICHFNETLFVVSSHAKQIKGIVAKCKKCTFIYIYFLYIIASHFIFLADR